MVDSVLKQLTLEEKCALLSGVDFWHTTPIKRAGVPSVMMADGPHGLRKETKKSDIANVMQKSQPATCFPPAVTLASTWDRDLVADVAKAIADEAIDQELVTVLGPGINIKRNPLCGRNFEYYSEDPYLAGELCASYINGMQSKGVGTSLKHFAVNSQEYRRLTISSEVDGRAIREIYLAAFETAVKKSQPYTIMCSYNRINGLHASENKWLLTDVLRKEWGFKGIVVSDWGAVNDRVLGVQAGLDLEMPTSSGVHDKMIFDAVQSGKISEEDVDVCAKRMLEYIFKCYNNKKASEGKKCDYSKSHKLARKAAASGAVLLKNEKALPIKESDDIAVIGWLAKTMRYQGGGSSNINPMNLVNFTDHLDAEKIPYAYTPGYGKGDGRNKKLLEEAVALAKEKKTVLLFVGLTDEYESEGYDRTHLELPQGHNDLVEAITAVNDNVIIVLSCGSPVQLPWLDKVKAVLNIYLGGEAAGEATADLLFGKVNPSGKLAETFPYALEDNPSYKYFQMGPRTLEHRESIYVGYRYFDKAGKEVRFPFGYGLSYTEFEYGNLSVEKTDKGVKVTFEVKNTGGRDGAEIAQVYVKDIESTIFREEKALKGFAKVFLKKGESKTVEILLDDRAFSFYNVQKNDWTIEKGEFEILVGANSRDIKLSAKIELDGETGGIADYKATAPVYYNLKETDDFSAAEFEAVLDRPLPENRPYAKGELDFNSTIEDAEVTWVGRLVSRATKYFSTKVVAKDAPESVKEMTRRSSVVMPLRSLYAMTNGFVPRETAEGVIMMFNGKVLRGAGRAVKYLIKNRKAIKKSDIYTE